MLASQIIYTACGKTKKGDFETWAKSVDITQAEDDEICDKMSYKRLKDFPPIPTQKEIDEIFPKKFSYFKLSSGRYCIAMSTYVGKVYSDEDNRFGNYVMHGYVFNKPERFVPVDFFASKLFKQSLSREEWFDIGAPDSLPQVDFPDSVDGLSDSDLREFFTPARLEKLKQLVQAVYNSLSSDEKVTFHDNHVNLPYWYKGISLCFDESVQSELTFCTLFAPGYTNTAANPDAHETEVKIRNVHPLRPGSPQFIYQYEAADGHYAFDFESGYYPDEIPVSKFVDAVVDGIVEDTDKVKSTVAEIRAICQKCGVDSDTALNVSYLLKGDIALLNDDYALIESLIRIFEKYYPERIQDTADAIYNYAIRDGRWLLSPDIKFLYNFITEKAAVVSKADMVTLYLENLAAFGVTSSCSALDFCESVKANAPFERWEYLENYLLVEEGLETYNSISVAEGLKSFFVYHTYANALPRMKNNDTYKKKIAVYVAKEVRRAIRDAYENDDRDVSEVKLLCEVIAKVEPTWPYSAVNSALTKIKNPDGSTIFEEYNKEFVLGLAETLDKDFRCRNGAVSLIIESARSCVNSPNSFLPGYIEHEKRNGELYAKVMNELVNDDTMQGFLNDLKFKKFEMADDPSKEAFKDFFRNRFVKGEDEMDVFCNKMLTKLGRSGDVIAECFDCMKNYIIPVKGTLDELCEERLDSLANNMRRMIFGQRAETVKNYVVAHGLKDFDDLDALCTDEFTKPVVYDVMEFYVNTIRPYLTAQVAPSVTSSRTYPVNASNAQQPADVQEAVNPVDRFAEKKKELIPRNNTKTEDEEKEISGYVVKWYMDSLMKLYIKFEDQVNFTEVFETFFRGYRIDSNSYGRAYVEALNSLNGDGGDPSNDYIRMLHATIIYNGVCKAMNTPNSEKLEQLYTEILDNAFKAIPKKHVKFVISKLFEVSSTNPKWSVKQYDKLVSAYLNEYQAKAKENSFFGRFTKIFEKKAQKAAEKKAKRGGAPAPEEQTSQPEQSESADNE